MKRKKSSRKGASAQNAATAEMKILQQAARLHQVGRLDEAQRLYRQILGRNPRHPDALNLSGMASLQSGDTERAVKMFESAAQAQPESPDVWNNLGAALRAENDLEGAMTAYDRALDLRPDYAEALNGLAAAHLDREESEPALERCRRAIALKPGFAEAHYNMGNALKKTGKREEAFESFRRAVALKPDYAEAQYNMGLSFHEDGDLDAAAAAYGRAIKIAPDYVDAHHNLALTFLLGGRLKEGWAEFEWRWRKPDVPWRPFPQALWDGSSLDGKSILVWGEMGIGDEIRFAGMVPELVDRGATVVVECEPRLVPLFERSFAQVTCVGQADRPPPRLLSDTIDFQVPMGGLARFLRPDPESFPPHTGYLKADPGQTRELRERYESGDDLVVGISWASSATAWNVTWPELAHWRPLLSAPGVTFVNLQYGETSADRADFLEHAGVDLLHDETVDPLTDMDAFASQTAAMDLVISIGNSTVEVAGALGIPVWTLVLHEPNWVWLQEGADSPWYPSMRLYRQPERGDWESVMTDVTAELRRKVAER